MSDPSFTNNFRISLLQSATSHRSYTRVGSVCCISKSISTQQPYSVIGNTPDFDSAFPGSIPGRATSPPPLGFTGQAYPRRAPRSMAGDSPPASGLPALTGATAILMHGVMHRACRAVKNNLGNSHLENRF